MRRSHSGRATLGEHACWQRKARPVIGTDGSLDGFSAEESSSGWIAALRSRNSYTAPYTCDVPRQMNLALHARSTTRKHWHTHMTSYSRRFFQFGKVAYQSAKEHGRECSEQGRLICNERGISRSVSVSIAHARVAVEGGWRAARRMVRALVPTLGWRVRQRPPHLNIIKVDLSALRAVLADQLVRESREALVAPAHRVLPGLHQQ